MIRQTSLAQTIDLAADKARYDACAKKILSFRAIIAWILKCCTKEFSQYTVPYIYDNCLPEAAEISTHAVHQDEKNGSEILDGDQRIDGQNTEANSIKEQAVYFKSRISKRIRGRAARQRSCLLMCSSAIRRRLLISVGGFNPILR